MQNPKLTADQVRDNLEVKLARYFGCTAAEATNDQMYKATAMTVRDILTEKRGAFKKKVNQTGSKRVYYMCMEFLLGRSLKNNLCNLGLDATYGKAWASRWRSCMTASRMPDWATAVWGGLPPASWIRCPRWIIPPPASRCATITVCSGR